MKKAEITDPSNSQKSSVTATYGGVSGDEGWKKRLCSLSKEEQYRISKKYYGGAMPWKQ